MKKVTVLFLLSTMLYAQQIDMLYSKYLTSKQRYNYIESESLLNEILSIKDSILYLNSLVEIYELTGKYDSAVVYLNKTLREESDTISINIRIANNYSMGKKYNLAMKYYSKIPEYYLNYYLYEKIGDSYYKCNKIDSAIIAYKKSIDMGNTSQEIKVKIAKIFIQNKDYETALEYLNHGLNYNPDNLAILKLCTEVYFTIRDYLNTVNYGLQVIDLGDTTFSITQKLGLAYYYIAEESVSRGTDIKYWESIKYLNIASTLEKNDALTYFYTAMNYTAIDSADSAYSYFERSLNTIFPDFIDDIYLQLGSLNQKKENYSAAIQSFKQAKKYSPNNNNLYLYLAVVYDKYYKDRSTPLLYYNVFLKNAKNADEKLVLYAKERVDVLTEEIHFSNN